MIGSPSDTDASEPSELGFSPDLRDFVENGVDGPH